MTAMTSLKPRQIEFNELTGLLGEYERKYNLSTIEFFHRYSTGILGDDDDLMLWAGIYHLCSMHPIIPIYQLTPTINTLVPKRRL